MSFIRPVQASVLGQLPFSTTFPANQNPLSEGGIWRGGQTVGLQWQNMRSISGNAVGINASPTDDDDSIDCLEPTIFTTFTRRQYAKGICHRAPGYNPAVVHEIELHLLCVINANSISTYELLTDSSGGYSINRWNGTFNDVTVMPISGSMPNLADGDEVLFRVDQNGNFESFVNGSPGLTLTDTAFISGTPGIAAFWRPDASIVAANFGWQSVEMGNW